MAGVNLHYFGLPVGGVFCTRWWEAKLAGALLLAARWWEPKLAGVNLHYFWPPGGGNQNWLG